MMISQMKTMIQWWRKKRVRKNSQ